MDYKNSEIRKAAITGVGGFVPEDKLTNSDLLKLSNLIWACQLSFSDMNFHQSEFSIRLVCNLLLRSWCMFVRLLEECMRARVFLKVYSGTVSVSYRSAPWMKNNR